jgi:alpha-tubulin suppressor-like RCC1 family protein
MRNFTRKHYHVLSVIILVALIAACGSRVNSISSSTNPSPIYAHSVAFNNNATFTWGAGNYGQLGNGDSTGATQRTPVQVIAPAATGMIGASAGGTHILAFNASGNVFAWGNNGFSQLGNNSTTATATPVQVINLTGVTAVSAGGSHSLAIANQNVWAWGSNSEGQLGVATTTTLLSLATQITGLATVTKIAAGGAHSIALMSDQTVQSWGSNTTGQLGIVPPIPTSTSISTPGPVVKDAGSLTLSPVTDIAAGGSHSLFVAAGAVWACGLNVFGQLGNGTTTNSIQGVVPVLNASGGQFTTGAIAVAAGLDHSLALINGSVWAWGLNNIGQLGNGADLKSSTLQISTVPVQVKTDGTGHPFLSGIVKIVAIGNHNLAVDSSGQLWAWGGNENGQLGIAANDTADRNFATKVPGFTATSVL